MLIMLLVSNNIARGLEKYQKDQDPKGMSDKLIRDYDQVSPELRQLATQKLNSFRIDESKSVRDTRVEFTAIIEALEYQLPVGQVISEEDKVMALFAGMPRREYGILRHTSRRLSHLA